MTYSPQEWLDTVRHVSAEIEPLQREISALEMACQQCVPWKTKSASYGSTHGAYSDPTATQVQARLSSQLEGKLAATRNQLTLAVKVVGDCGTVLDRMTQDLGPSSARVLELYYVDVAETWSQVAAELDCGRMTVWRAREAGYDWIAAHYPRLLEYDAPWIAMSAKALERVEDKP